MLERFVDRTCRHPADVLADHTDGDFACRVGLLIDDLFPLGQIGFLCSSEAKTVGDQIVQPLFLQHGRDL